MRIAPQSHGQKMHYYLVITAAPQVFVVENKKRVSTINMSVVTRVAASINK